MCKHNIFFLVQRYPIPYTGGPDKNLSGDLILSGTKIKCSLQINFCDYSKGPFGTAPPNLRLQLPGEALPNVCTETTLNREQEPKLLKELEPLICGSVPAPSPTGRRAALSHGQTAVVRAPAVRRRLLPQVRLTALPRARPSSG